MFHMMCIVSPGDGLHFNLYFPMCQISRVSEFTFGCTVFGYELEFTKTVSSSTPVVDMFCIVCAR